LPICLPSRSEAKKSDPSLPHHPRPPPKTQIEKQHVAQAEKPCNRLKPTPRSIYSETMKVSISSVNRFFNIVLGALAMLVVCWRRLPAPYTLFAAGVLVVALSGSNLDSFERYAMSAFPLSMAAAFLLDRPQLERTVLTLLAAGLAGYALLAFLNISVP